MTSNDLEMHNIEFRKNSLSNDMHILCILPYFRILTPNDLFWPHKMTSDDLEMHKNELRRKFPIEWYVYLVYLAMFQIFDLKMPFLTPKMTSTDLGRPHMTS